jgi:hypothetical protein
MVDGIASGGRTLTQHVHRRTGTSRGLVPERNDNDVNGTSHRYHLNILQFLTLPVTCPMSSDVNTDCPGVVVGRVTVRNIVC